jgi:hypothetical protein
MRSELLGLRTAGSAWSGSHPAVCESANHGRHGGHGPSATGTAGSVWTGRNVAARCDLAGMVRRGYGQSGLFMAGMAPRQGSVLCGEHGRLRLRELSAIDVWQHAAVSARMGKDPTDPAWHGRQGMSRRPQSAHGRCRMVSDRRRPDTARQEWHRNGWSAIRRLRSALLGLVWLGRQRTATHE